MKNYKFKIFFKMIPVNVKHFFKEITYYLKMALLWLKYKLELLYIWIKYEFIDFLKELPIWVEVGLGIIVTIVLLIPTLIEWLVLGDGIFATIFARNFLFWVGICRETLKLIFSEDEEEIDSTFDCALEENKLVFDVVRMYAERPLI